jgi:putative transposase
MPDYVRWREKGATYFFTVVTYRRRRILSTALGRRLLRQAMVVVRAKRPFDMPACVLLPDHLHCIWTLPEDNDDFPLRWRQIKEWFTRKYLAAGGSALAVTEQQRRQGRLGVWQSRYWEHRIRDEEDYLRHRDYIHLNPVKHGYVSTPEQWAWSSFHRHVRLGWLDPNWPGASPVELPDVRE